MGSFDWDPRFETGDALVDLHHKTIHALFDNLESAADTGEQIMHALEYLSEYVLMHFATEEDLMRRENYAQDLFDTHVAEHRRLTDDVRDRVLEFRTGQLTSIAPLVEFLREWIDTHIHECDKLLIDHVRINGGVAILPEPWATAGPPTAA